MLGTPAAGAGSATGRFVNPECRLIRPTAHRQTSALHPSCDRLAFRSVAHHLADMRRTSVVGGHGRPPVKHQVGLDMVRRTARITYQRHRRPDPTTRRSSARTKPAPNRRPSSSGCPTPEPDGAPSEMPSLPIPLLIKPANAVKSHAKNSPLNTPKPLPARPRRRPWQFVTLKRQNQTPRLYRKERNVGGSTGSGKDHRARVVHRGRGGCNAPLQPH